MDDDVVSALEASIADLGTLLVQMDKFRAAATDEARGLRGACLAIGDRARRAHRHATLDAALAGDLAADAAAARTALERWLADVRSSPPYRAAVAALAAADERGLRASLTALFAGVEAVEPPEALFHPVAWQRRGRPRPAPEIADDLVRVRADGIAGENDPAAVGVDPALPGVVLQAAPPPGAPLYLVVRGPARPSWVLALRASGEFVVPGARLRAAFAVGLAADDEEEVDAWTMDPVAYRDALRAACTARALPLDEERTT